MTPNETGSCLFTDAVFENLVEQTHLYAPRDKWNHNFCLTRSDVYQFIGTLLLSGYHKVRKERDYWSCRIDLHVPFIDRYLKIQTLKDKAVFTCCRQQNSC